MNRPKFRTAVVTGAYNNGKYFAEYWNGILRQTTKPDYVVYVDDASTDGSMASIKNYLDWNISNEGTVSGIKLVLIQRKENGGPGAARNTALKYLEDKVDIICMCDADDVYLKDKISESLNILYKYPGVSLVYSDYNVLNQRTGEITRTFKEVYKLERLMQECIISNNSVFYYGLCKDCDFYDEDKDLRAVEDYLMWKKMGLISRAYHLPLALYNYRVHDSNATVITPPEILNYRHSVMHRKLDEWIKKGGHLEKFAA